MKLKDLVTIKIGDSLIFQHPKDIEGLLTKAKVKKKIGVYQVKLNKQWFHLCKIKIYCHNNKPVD